MKIKKHRCVLKIIDNIALDEKRKFFHLILENPNWDWKPGQFVMVKLLKPKYEPFLPRPFSIANIDIYLHLYYQVVGKGTELLSFLKKGEDVLIWGPLGNGFDYKYDEELLLLAGGMGIVPFLGLVVNHPDPDKLELIFGHRNPIHCYPYEEISKRILAWNIMDISAEDLKKLKRAIKVKIENYAKDGKVLACGPKPFLKMIHEFVIKYKAEAQFSLETFMACGIGACLGCTILDKNKNFLQVCQDGPVFNAAILNFNW